MTGIKRLKRYYPVEVKLEAVRLFFEGGLTQQEISEKLELNNRQTVKNWVRLYRREGEAGFCKRIGRKQKVQSEAQRIQQLEMENALLKKYRTELRKSLLAKRNIGLSTTTEKNTK